jgi:hypothetical protein
MENLADNYVVRFINVTKKKDGMFVNFKAKGIRGGVFFNASFSVDLESVEVDPQDPLEIIIKAAAQAVERELKRSNFEFEGIAAV